MIEKASLLLILVYAISEVTPQQRPQRWDPIYDSTVLIGDTHCERTMQRMMVASQLMRVKRPGADPQMAVAYRQHFCNPATKARLNGMLSFDDYECLRGKGVDLSVTDHCFGVRLLNMEWAPNCTTVTSLFTCIVEHMWKVCPNRGSTNQTIGMYKEMLTLVQGHSNENDTGIEACEAQLGEKIDHYTEVLNQFNTKSASTLLGQTLFSMLIIFTIRSLFD